MSQPSAASGTPVRVEIRGRMTNRKVFDIVCAIADADLDQPKGRSREILLEAIRTGGRAILEGVCPTFKPRRLTDLARELQIPMVFVLGHEDGKNHGETYCVNEKWGVGPTLPLTEQGPAITASTIDHMIKHNPFYGLEEIKRALKKYDPETYPAFTMTRALQVELMPGEKVGLFAGMRR